MNFNLVPFNSVQANTFFVYKSVLYKMMKISGSYIAIEISKDSEDVIFNLSGNTLVQPVIIEEIKYRIK